MNPCLRTDIEPVPVDIDGHRMIALRDPQAMAKGTATVTPAALHLLQFFDGEHSLETMRVELARHGAGFVGLDDLQELVDALDECLLLDNDRYHDETARRAHAFFESPVRAAAHADAAYPGEPGEARTFLQDMLDAVDAVAPREQAPLARLIAPHIDLRLGADIHAHAHRRLEAAGRPDVVVVLGVCHAASRGRFILCRKDFATPFGVVPHDTALADALETALDTDLTEEQLLHRDEHSIEFQALWIAHHWPDDPPAIVPLLVGSFHDLVEDGASPLADPQVAEFIDALRTAVAGDGRRIVVLASVDFSHVGPMYGHENGLDESGEEQLVALDRTLLDRIEAGDAEGFFDELARDQNSRHVCGLAPVYVTLKLGEGRGDLLRYGQGRIDPGSGSVVSYAAVAFER
ncbi:MAG: AmmeMemoRadiSam system protein B [Planctomycetota bacterium]